MKEDISFHIPKPCHENWDNMTPEGKGRFCASCSKQVIDFSLMSDQQVLSYFKEASGKVCGRFANDQLQRPMQPVKQPKKKSWWYAAMMPLLMVFNKTEAQNKNVNTTKGTPAMVVSTVQPEIMGKVSPIIIPVDTPKQQCTTLLGDTVIVSNDVLLQNEFVIKGKIVDQVDGSPIPFATVALKHTTKAVACDIQGNFILIADASDKNQSLVVSCVGYETKEVDINNNLPENISLDQTENSLPALTVVTAGLINAIGC